jgi:hypothetical protein
MSNTEKITEIKNSFGNMVDSFFGVIDEIHQQQKQEIIQLIKSNLNTKTITVQELQEIATVQQPAVNLNIPMSQPMTVEEPKITAVITPVVETFSIETIKAKYQMEPTRFSKHGNAFLYRPLNLTEYKNLLGNNLANLKYHPIINDLNQIRMLTGKPNITRNDIGGWGFKLISANDSFLFKKEFLIEIGINPDTIITSTV